MKAVDNTLYESENYGGEFSILNSFSHPKREKKELSKTSMQTIFLIALSAISVIFWVISLNILPFGHIFQYLLGSVVLSINLIVFKWMKLFI